MKNERGCPATYPWSVFCYECNELKQVILVCWRGFRQQGNETADRFMDWVFVTRVHLGKNSGEGAIPWEDKQILYNVNIWHMTTAFRFNNTATQSNNTTSLATNFTLYLTRLSPKATIPYHWLLTLNCILPLFIKYLIVKLYRGSETLTGYHCSQM